MTLVQVMGKEIKDLNGLAIKNIRLYAATPGGEIKPIPFQIDEKISVNSGKTRTFALHSFGGKIEPANPPNGLWDSDEPLLFLKKDGGPPVDPGVFSKARKAQEIFLDTDGKNRVYLTWEETPLPKSAKTYISYDPMRDQIDAETFQISFSQTSPLVQNQLIIKNVPNPENILDRFKSRFKLAVKPFFEFKFNESEIQTKKIGYRAGPIRVIREILAWKNIGPIRLMPKSKVKFLFYPDWVEVPTQINNPVDGPATLKDKTEGINGFDFNRKILGSQFYNNLNKGSLVFDGLPEKEIRWMVGPSLRWWALTGAAGSILVEIQNDPMLKKLDIHLILILIDDLSSSNAPESESGELMVGFDMPYHKIPKGNYEILVKQIFPKVFQKGRETEYIESAKIIAPSLIRGLRVGYGQE